MLLQILTSFSILLPKRLVFFCLLFCLFLPAACFVQPSEYCQLQILAALLVEKLERF